MQLRRWFNTKLQSLEYNNYKLQYIMTNYGTLFVVKGLATMMKKRHVNSQEYDRYINRSLTVSVPVVKDLAITCTGLKGVQQIFADTPDPVLEKVLIDKGIVQGDLPFADDIVIVQPEQKSDIKSKDTKIESDIKDLRKQVRTLMRIVAEMQKANESLQQMLRIQQRLCYNSTL